MSAFLGATVTAWSDILTLQLKTMFDGSDASISTLYTLIDDTNLAFSQNTTSVTDLMPKIEKALLGYMIPVAWSLSTLNVLVSLHSCSQARPILTCSLAFYCVRPTPIHATRS